MARAPAVEHPEKNRFRFGNGQEELSEKVARIPVAIQGKVGIIDCSRDSRASTSPFGSSNNGETECLLEL